MSKKIYVYSTMTGPVEYAIWARGGGDIPTIRKSVRIEGGANVADKHLYTPRGVLTIISEEDYDILQQDGVFQIHKENGFITVEQSQASSIERAVADMESQDNSAPLTPNDFDGVGGPKPEQTDVPVAAPVAKTRARSRAK
jgi:hypothetical protein